MRVGWRPVIGFEGYYEVSNIGGIRSVDRDVPCSHSNSGYRRLKAQRIVLTTSKSGYIQVGLCRDSKKRQYLVHRLVALAFIPNPDNKPEVNHIDGVKGNNHISNLEWVTSKENQDHAYAAGLQIIRRGDKAPNYKGAVSVYKDGELVQILKGKREIIEAGFCQRSVYKCLNGVHKTHKGFTFMRES